MADGGASGEELEVGGGLNGTAFDLGRDFCATRSEVLDLSAVIEQVQALEQGVFPASELSEINLRFGSTTW
jgi:hypothetical protein